MREIRTSGSVGARARNRRGDPTTPKLSNDKNPWNLFWPPGAQSSGTFLAPSGVLTNFQMFLATPSYLQYKSALKTQIRFRLYSLKEFFNSINPIGHSVTLQMK